MANEARYATWAQNYAVGVQAAADKTARARAASHPYSVASRAGKVGNRCGIKGCTRSAHKGRLCAAHWRMIPQSDKAALVADCIMASRRTAEKHHRRFLRELQAKLKA